MDICEISKYELFFLWSLFSYEKLLGLVSVFIDLETFEISPFWVHYNNPCVNIKIIRSR
jgi:hypothetical protein